MVHQILGLLIVYVHLLLRSFRLFASLSRVFTVRDRASLLDLRSVIHRRILVHKEGPAHLESRDQKVETQPVDRVDRLQS